MNECNDTNVKQVSLRAKHPDVPPTDLVLKPKPTFRAIVSCVRAARRLKTSYINRHFKQAMVVRARSSRNL